MTISRIHGYLQKGSDIPGITKHLEKYAKEYKIFERRVRNIITAECLPFCSSCKSTCCKIDFCRESTESLWLRYVRSVGKEEDRYFYPKTGWLRSYGCALKTGRPPVCYEFFCSALLDSIANPLKRYALVVLGRLVSFIGERALGQKHLVVLTSMEELRRIHIERLRHRLEKGMRVMAQCSEILNGVSEIDNLDELQEVARVPSVLKTALKFQQGVLLYGKR